MQVINQQLNEARQQAAATNIQRTCARRRQLGWFVSGLPWGLEPHDNPIGEQWGGR